MSRKQCNLADHRVFLVKAKIRNEQLVFDFATNSLATSIEILFSGIDFYETMEAGDKKDELILYVDTGGSHLQWDLWDTFTANMNTCENQGGAADDGTYSCLLRLSLLGASDNGAGSLAGILTSTIAVRGYGGETRISGLSVGTSVVPVPAAFWLFGTTIFGLIGMRRKAKLAA